MTLLRLTLRSLGGKRKIIESTADTSIEMLKESFERQVPELHQVKLLFGSREIIAETVGQAGLCDGAELQMVLEPDLAEAIRVVKFYFDRVSSKRHGAHYFGRMLRALTVIEKRGELSLKDSELLRKIFSNTFWKFDLGLREAYRRLARVYARTCCPPAQHGTWLIDDVTHRRDHTLDQTACIMIALAEISDRDAGALPKDLMASMFDTHGPYWGLTSVEHCKLIGKFGSKAAGRRLELSSIPSSWGFPAEELDAIFDARVAAIAEIKMRFLRDGEIPDTLPVHESNAVDHVADNAAIAQS